MFFNICYKKFRLYTINDELECNTKLTHGVQVYIACFVGCTYHCG